MSARLPRFKRVTKSAPIQLTARDRLIIQTVHQHRFLRSAHILQLVPGSSHNILRRLQLLYHHGFLERPRAQLDYYHKGGSHSMVYGLGQKGIALLRDELGLSSQKLRWGEKNRSVGRIFLEHALSVSDVMVKLEMACRNSASVQLLTERGLAGPDNIEGAFRWRVKVDGRSDHGVVPDRVFALEFTREDGTRDRAFFFLEADRGTMPVIRRNLSQSSLYRKLLAYEVTWSQAIHRKRFGFHRFRVLTVMKSPVRIRSLVEACSQLRTGHGLFLFTDYDSLLRAEDTLSLKWRTPRQGEAATLLD